MLDILKLAVVLLVISAIAVFFEVTPVLRGTTGNIAYFFIWNVLLILSLSPATSTGIPMVSTNDLPGITRLFSDMIQEAAHLTGQTFKNMSLGVQIIGETDGTSGTFIWNGLDWTASVILERLLWVGLAFGIVLAATPIFRRFESPTLSSRRLKKSQLSPNQGVTAVSSINTHAKITPLTETLHMSFLPLLRSEILLALRGVNRWWYLGMAGLIVLTLVTPITTARQYLFPLAWIWPVAVWSTMGTRETAHRTEQVIFSAPRSLKYQLPAMWTTGVLVTALAGMGMALRLLIAGETNSLLAWAVGVLFIPTLALAAGVWTGRAILFEALYVALWYVGPMNQVPYLDFMGATSSVTPAISLAFAIVTVALLVLAWVGRRRQMTL